MAFDRASGVDITVTRQNLNDNYLITPNDLFRGSGVYEGLSEFARLWLGAGLTCANHWKTTLADIEAWLPSLGRDRHESVRRELRERGFLTLTRSKVPAGQPDAGKWRWTFAFFMDPLPPEQRDQLQARKKSTKQEKLDTTDSAPMPGISGTRDSVEESAGHTTPGFPGHGDAGHGEPGPGDQGDVKEEKNHSEKNHLPPTPQTDTAATEPTGAATRGEDFVIDEKTREELNRCVDRVHQLRPGWAPGAIRSAIKAALIAGRDSSVVTRAMLAVAKDPASKVPGRLNQEGDWWGLAPERPARETVVRCGKRTHERQPADGCLACLADAKACPECPRSAKSCQHGDQGEPRTPLSDAEIKRLPKAMRERFAAAKVGAA